MGDIVNFDREPPADLDVDARGLPPARAGLARLAAWGRREAAALARLQTGRVKLADRIAHLDAAARLDEATDEASAAGIVEQIRRGINWTLSAPRKRALPDCEILTIARAALVKLDEEIAAKHNEIAEIGERIAEAAHAALIEHAKATIAADYLDAIEALRAGMIKLEGLDVALGTPRDGRTVGELPGFAIAGHPLPMAAVAASQSEIAAAAETWRELARAWAEAPRADASKHLHFPEHDPAALADMPYENLSPAERRQVDAKFANH